MTEDEQYILGQWMHGVEDYLREIAKKAGIPPNRMDTVLQHERDKLLALPPFVYHDPLNRAERNALSSIVPIGGFLATDAKFGDSWKDESYQPFSDPSPERLEQIRQAIADAIVETNAANEGS